jgi:two-component system sensor histidine kinase PilS (NtrC family)
VAALLVGVIPWAPPIFVPTVSVGLPLTVFAIVVASSGALLLLGPSPRPRSVAWLLCLLDATLVTAVVSATGGARSVLVFLYVLLVTAACALLSRWGALALAGVSSALYAALVLMRSLVPVLAFGAPVDETTALDVLAIFVNSSTLVIVSLVVGGLAERHLVSQRELEAQRRSFSDLQAFSDVIFQSVGMGVIALDHAHRITAFNRAAEAITGVRASTALGARWADLFGAGLPLVEIEAGIAGRTRTSRHEAELRRPDGVLVPVRVAGSALEAGDGTRLGLVATCEDLSSIRAMEARIRQADRLASLGRMAANLAHEIRNPLASLSGAVEALVHADPSAETRSRLTEIVVRESDRLSAIIRNFLEYAHPAALVVEPLDVADVLDDVLRALGQRLPPWEVKIVRTLPASLPLEADRERLRQVLWTLCVNAVQAMPTGGELWIGGGTRAGMVEIRFADTGEGIPPDDLPHVFEPFFTTRHDTGGLGLALVHRIVEEHGGDVTVRSEHGLGAEFTLRLPERRA